MFPLTINNTPIKVKMARTGREQRRGLMFVDHLPQDQGMLFHYPKSQPLSFWMKNVKIPLSIAFIDSLGKIVAIKHGAPGDLTTIKSPCPCKWALEMNKDWFRNNNVKVGDTIDYCANYGRNIKIKIV
jgi:uncharacterized membrane protein (UPF0127 family)|tara:strand:- start:17988 stop:18371 length:384 start_codon:yes stop_codon:yes gene_type:complete